MDKKDLRGFGFNSYKIGIQYHDLQKYIFLFFERN